MSGRPTGIYGLTYIGS
ncbi:hypothetical protein A2U01_0105896, partial [Trifolium medium]|nr:hypothetical protein [Trifolium medium]